MESKMHKNFINISRKKIIEAIGTLTVTAVHINTLDPEKSGCFSCVKNYNGSGCEAQTWCESAKFKDETIYTYERKKMNIHNQLPLNAIKLYCYLHACTTNGRGWISDFDASMVSDVIHCCPQTVYASLKLLAERGYILMSRGNADSLYTIYIIDYDRMYDAATLGGCGYFQLSKTLLNIIYSCESINILRCFFRLWDFIAQKSAKSTAAVTIKITWKDIYACYPQYVTRKHVLAAISALADVMVCNIQKHYIICTMQPQYDVKTAKTEALQYSSVYLKNKCNALKNAIDMYNSLRKKEKKRKQVADIKDKLSAAGIHLLDTDNDLNSVSYTDKDMADMVQMAVEYNPEIVLDAYIYAYNNILQFENNINNLGGLIRTIIREWLEWPLYTAA